MQNTCTSTTRKHQLTAQARIPTKPMRHKCIMRRCVQRPRGGQALAEKIVDSLRFRMTSARPARISGAFELHNVKPRFFSFQFVDQNIQAFETLFIGRPGGQGPVMFYFLVEYFALPTHRRLPTWKPSISGLSTFQLCVGAARPCDAIGLFRDAVHSPSPENQPTHIHRRDCRTSYAADSIRQNQHALHDCPEADKHDEQSQQVRKPPIGRETIDRPKANCPDDDDDQYANQNRNQPHGMILRSADNSIDKSRATVNGNNRREAATPPATVR